MKKLGEMEIDSILLEGGPTLAESAIREGIVNEIYTFVAPKIFGGSTAKSPVGGEGVEIPDQAHMFEIKSVKTIGDDVLIFSKKRED
jgi:diaminohydroxyphosphoribosylaminopyrimidine deaminase/5-amino-6-(5-phosphoribosylamino)uracil reductase